MCRSGRYGTGKGDRRLLPHLTAVFVTVRCLIQQARNRYRWDT
ncbi:hypothetical protein [Streptomyces sp. AP-93]|nr:hypothetical protein [Streptomyces sp. AP-93]